MQPYTTYLHNHCDHDLYDGFPDTTKVALNLEQAQRIIDLSAAARMLDVNSIDVFHHGTEFGDTDDDGKFVRNNKYRTELRCAVVSPRDVYFTHYPKHLAVMIYSERVEIAELLKYVMAAEQ